MFNGTAGILTQKKRERQKVSKACAEYKFSTQGCSRFFFCFLCPSVCVLPNYVTFTLSHLHSSVSMLAIILYIVIRRETVSGSLAPPLPSLVTILSVMVRIMQIGECFPNWESGKKGDSRGSRWTRIRQRKSDATGQES